MQVLIAHLGEICVDNSGMQNIPSESGRGQFKGQNQDLINLSLTNMNLYSLHLGQQTSVTTLGLNSSKLPELTHKFGLPILYDTSVDLTIGKRELDFPFVNQNVSPSFEDMMGFGRTSPHKSKSEHDESDEDYHQQHITSLLDIKAKISSPLKLSLSKEVYEQILQTVDNLTYDRESFQQFSHKSHHTVTRTSSTPSSTDASRASSNLTAQVDKEFLTGRPSSPHMNPNIHGSFDQDLHLAGDSFLAKHVEFDVPLFEVELRGDFGEKEQGLVDLKLYDFSMRYEKNDKVNTRMNLHLKSLQMDDLLEPADSKHRQIIMSRPSRSRER